MQFTTTSEKVAVNCLQTHDWKIEVAIDQYFQNPDRYAAMAGIVKEAGTTTSSVAVMNRGNAVDPRKIERIFLQYADAQENKILPEGMQRFLDDLGLDPTSLPVLVLAYKFGAQIACEFSKEEFMNGMNALG